MICYRGEKDIYNLSGGNIHCTNLINPGKLTNPLQDQSEAALYTFLGQEQLRPGEPDQLKHDWTVGRSGGMPTNVNSDRAWEIPWDRAWLRRGHMRVFHGSVKWTGWYIDNIDKILIVTYYSKNVTLSWQLAWKKCYSICPFVCIFIICFLKTNSEWFKKLPAQEG